VCPTNSGGRSRSRGSIKLSWCPFCCPSSRSAVHFGVYRYEHSRSLTIRENPWLERLPATSGYSVSLAVNCPGRTFKPRTRVRIPLGTPSGYTTPRRTAPQFHPNHVNAAARLDYGLIDSSGKGRHQSRRPATVHSDHMTGSVPD